MDETPPRPKSDRTWLYVGLAFAVVWGLYLAFFNPRIGPESVPVPDLEGTGLALPADYGWRLESLDGKPVALADYKGKPVVLNIWATWCPPCRAEMPSLARLAADPAVGGVAFLCVTTEDATPAVKSYVTGSMAGLTALRADDVPAVFQTEGIPATFVIAPDGRVVASTIGAARWDDPTVVAFLKRLLAEAPARS